MLLGCMGEENGNRCGGEDLLAAQVSESAGKAASSSDSSEYFRPAEITLDRQSA